MLFPHDRSVMIVDDEPVITELVSAALRKDDFFCETASNGAEALEKLSANPSAFVLTDVRMPVMTGLDLLEQVRVHYPDSFVILLTGAADVPTVVRALRAGACDFMTKPFSLDELRSRMQLALERRSEALATRAREHFRERRLEHLAERYHDLAEGIIASLNAVLGIKHPETQAHSERVALRAANLAAALGVRKEEVQAIYIAGLLHDIGKVAVDAQLLDKPGKLEAGELTQIRSHPEQSAKIAAPVAISKVTLDAIRHHHERFDGNGYPNRLRGEEIPLAARVLAVCDAYDAMISQRAYSPALPPTEGLQRLREGAGKQWDPHIVCVFCQQEESELPTHAVTANPVPNEARLELRPAWSANPSS